MATGYQFIPRSSYAEVLSSHIAPLLQYQGETMVYRHPDTGTRQNVVLIDVLSDDKAMVKVGTMRLLVNPAYLYVLDYWK